LEYIELVQTEAAGNMGYTCMHNTSCFEYREQSHVSWAHTKDEKEVGEDGAQVGETCDCVESRRLLGQCHAGQDELHDVSEGRIDKAADDVPAA
jgi:hypothetical protein